MAHKRGNTVASIPTVRICDPNSKGDFVVINEADFSDGDELFKDAPAPRARRQRPEPTPMVDEDEEGGE